MMKRQLRVWTMDNNYNHHTEYIKLGNISYDEAMKIMHEKGMELVRKINRDNKIKDYQVSLIPDNE